MSLLLFVLACAPHAPLTPPDSMGADGVEVDVQCVDSGCVGTIRVGTQEALLPGFESAWNIDGVEVRATARQDLDSDGQPELLVVHRVTEPPRPAVGSRSTEWLTVFSLPELVQRANVELGHQGGLSEETCGATLELSGPRRIAWTMECAPNRDDFEARTNLVVVKGSRPL